MKKMELHKQKLLAQMKLTNKLSIAEAKEILNVSQSTVQRLFIDLEKTGMAIRCYGGIMLVPETAPEYLYEKTDACNIEQKRLIADIAVGMVDSGDTLYLDSGTTLCQFSLALARRIKAGELERLTVFTNSLVNFDALSNSNCPIILIGGEYRGHRKDFCGYVAEESLKILNFNKCFLGTDGYDANLGFTTTDFATARLNELVLKNTKKRFVLMDSSKFKSSAMVSYSKKAKVDGLFTDKIPTEDMVLHLKECGIEVTVCN